MSEIDFMEEVYRFAKKFDVENLEEPYPLWDGDWTALVGGRWGIKEKTTALARAYWHMAKRNHKVVNQRERPTEDEMAALWTSIHPVLAIQSKSFPSRQLRIDALQMASSAAYRTMEHADRTLYGPTGVFFLVRRAMQEGRRLDRRSSNVAILSNISSYERETASVIDRIIYRDQFNYTNNLMDGLVDTWADMRGVVHDEKISQKDQNVYKNVIRSMLNLKHKRKMTSNG
jgi:hypothetical protein